MILIVRKRRANGPKDDVETLSSSGRYRDLLALFESHPELAVRAPVENIMARVFTGRVHEAEILFEQELRRDDVIARTGALFYLVIGHTRVSAYEQARKR